MGKYWSGSVTDDCEYSRFGGDHMAIRAVRILVVALVLVIARGQGIVSADGDHVRGGSQQIRPYSSTWSVAQVISDGYLTIGLDDGEVAAEAYLVYTWNGEIVGYVALIADVPGSYKATFWIHAGEEPPGPTPLVETMPLPALDSIPGTRIVSSGTVFFEEVVGDFDSPGEQVIRIRRPWDAPAGTYWAAIRLDVIGRNWRGRAHQFEVVW